MSPEKQELQLPASPEKKLSEGAVSPEVFSADGQKNPEILAPKELSQTIAAAGPGPQIDPATLASGASTINLGTASPAAQGVNPLLQAEDADLIEKIWVERAKTVIEHTQDDPYTQKNEISKVSADYLKQRFNKDIKLPDSGAAKQ